MRLLQNREASPFYSCCDQLTSATFNRVTASRLLSTWLTRIFLGVSPCKAPERALLLHYYCAPPEAARVVQATLHNEVCSARGAPRRRLFVFLMLRVTTAL
jgi:hypothetical protein